MNITTPMVALLSSLVEWNNLNTPCWIYIFKWIIAHINIQIQTIGTLRIRTQLNSHLQSNTLELDDKAQTLSYEHYYPYGGTAIIAGSSKSMSNGTTLTRPVGSMYLSGLLPT
jgi:hypothetical protein